MRKYLSKTIEYGLYFLVFILPLQTRWIIKAGFTEYQTYSLYGTDILLILVLICHCGRSLSRAAIREPAIQKLVPRGKTGFRLGGRNDNKEQIPNILIIGLLLVSFISVYFASDKALAFYKFGWLILGAGLFWLISAADYNRVKLIWSFLFGVAIQAALGIYQFLFQDSFSAKWFGLAAHRAADLGTSVIETVGADGVGERWLRAYGGLDHPNILGSLLAVGIILLISEILKKNNNILKIISWSFLIIFSAGLFFSFSRAAWLALGAGLATMLAGAVLKKDLSAQKNILQAVLISGAVFFILFFQYPNLAMTRLYGGDRLEIKSTEERIESVKYSLPIIKKNWLFGTGMGNYVVALEKNLPGRINYFYQPAHNVFILVLAEIGIIGLLIFVALLFVIARRPDALVGATKQSLVRFRGCEIASLPLVARNDNAAAILIALIVLMTFDHWLWSLHFGVLFFWLALGLTRKNCG